MIATDRQIEAATHDDACGCAVLRAAVEALCREAAVKTGPVAGLVSRRRLERALRGEQP